MNKYSWATLILILVMLFSIMGTIAYIRDSQSLTRLKNITASTKKVEIHKTTNDEQYTYSSRASLQPDLRKPDVVLATKQVTKVDIQPKITESTKLGLTVTQVSAHNSKASCWIIISNKVFDVTNFLSIHPGGVSIIVQYCGKDATNAFNSDSAGHNHSTYARSLLPTYFIGNIILSNF